MYTYLSSHVYIISYTNNIYVLFQMLQRASSTAAEPHTYVYTYTYVCTYTYVYNYTYVYT